MIKIRRPEEIYQAEGDIENGSFHGRWQFSFDMYYDPAFMHYGALRVFNDDTLSPGAIWPLHPHREIEVVTYCAAGEFRHADERGIGGVLKQGWVQHTTVGRGMYHSEINNLADQPMRFIQMWFIPDEPRLEPNLQQKQVERKDRTNRWLPLVLNGDPDALPIHSRAEVYACHLEAGKRVNFTPREGWGLYLYLVDDGPVNLNGKSLEAFGAAMIDQPDSLSVQADKESELLLVQVGLN